MRMISTPKSTSWGMFSGEKSGTMAAMDRPCGALRQHCDRMPTCCPLTEPLTIVTVAMAVDVRERGGLAWAPNVGRKKRGDERGRFTFVNGHTLWAMTTADTLQLILADYAFAYVRWQSGCRLGA